MTQLLIQAFGPTIGPKDEPLDVAERVSLLHANRRRQWKWYWTGKRNRSRSRKEYMVDPTTIPRSIQINAITDAGKPWSIKKNSIVDPEKMLRLIKIDHGRSRNIAHSIQKKIHRSSIKIQFNPWLIKRKLHNRSWRNSTVDPEKFHNRSRKKYMKDSEKLHAASSYRVSEIEFRPSLWLFVSNWLVRENLNVVTWSAGWARMLLMQVRQKPITIQLRSSGVRLDAANLANGAIYMVSACPWKTFIKLHIWSRICKQHLRSSILRN